MGVTSFEVVSKDAMNDDVARRSETVKASDGEVASRIEFGYGHARESIDG